MPVTPIGLDDLEETEEFRRALEVMEAAEEHAFITGRAGTGKSTLLRAFMARTKRRVAVVAPTGLAAINVGGQTIHSFFKFPPRVLHRQDVRPVPPSQRKLFEQLDTLIIDEISMVRADILDAIDQSLRLNRGRLEVPFGGVQLIAFGDLLQLSPVVQGELQQYFSDVYDTPYFFSANVLRGCDWQVIELTQNHRQGKDTEFFELLTRLGHGELSESDIERLNNRVVHESEQEEQVVTLTSTNASAAAINAARLEELEGELIIYPAIIKGDFELSSFPADGDLQMKEGAQVVLLRNDPDKRWVNGDVGVIDHCSAHELRVRIGNTVFDVKPVEWERLRYAYKHEENRMIQEVAGTFKQYPVKLAWALTIHKSQGQTLDRVVVDLGRGAFAHGQTYVALSRCTSLRGLWLRRPIRPRDIVFDERVLNFLRRASR